MGFFSTYSVIWKFIEILSKLRRFLYLEQEQLRNTICITFIWETLHNVKEVMPITEMLEHILLECNYIWNPDRLIVFYGLKALCYHYLKKRT